MLKMQSTSNTLNSVMSFKNKRKKLDRFNGISEEDILQRSLPDYLAPNLDIVVVGINPGLFSAYKGHHYAGPGNHFWKCLYMSGLIPEPMTALDDYKLLKYGIGFTNIVNRTTRGSADLTKKEIKEGSLILLQKLQKFKPKIALFNGKLIFETFADKKEFHFGLQLGHVEGTSTYMWVMPSSSARCSHFPRAADKVPFYLALKTFRDYINGEITNIDVMQLVFSDSKLNRFSESNKVKQNMENNHHDKDKPHLEDELKSKNDIATKHIEKYSFVKKENKLQVEKSSSCKKRKTKKVNKYSE